MAGRKHMRFAIALHYSRLHCSLAPELLLHMLSQYVLHVCLQDYAGGPHLKDHCPASGPANCVSIANQTVQ